MQFLLRLLRKIFGNPHFTGLLTDPRPFSEKQNDYYHEERVLGAVHGAFDNLQIQQSIFPTENQNYTSSCVPHGVGLALAIERSNDTGTFIRISQMFPYRLRSNYASEGCWPQDVFEKLRQRGAPLYESLPTPQTESEANAVILTNQLSIEAEIFKGNQYWTLKYPNEIQTIAEIAQQGHGVPITFFSTYDEWGREYPEIQKPNLTLSQAEVRHEVCVLPYSGFTKDGIRYVTIQDSAWFGGRSLRHVSEDFIKHRVYNAGYWDTVSVIGSGNRPKYQFTKTLKWGAVSNEVKQMQLLLIAEGLLPNDCATGNFYGRTLAAVRAFQNKYAEQILKPLGLDAPTETWGSMCIAQANRLCNGTNVTSVPN